MLEAKFNFKEEKGQLNIQGQLLECIADAAEMAVRIAQENKMIADGLIFGLVRSGKYTKEELVERINAAFQSLEISNLKNKFEDFDKKDTKNTQKFDKNDKKCENNNENCKKDDEKLKKNIKELKDLIEIANILTGFADILGEKDE